MTLIGILLLVTAVTILAGHFLGSGRAGRELSSDPLPPALQGTNPYPAIPTASRAARAKPTVVPDRPGVPVRMTVSGHVAQAKISANPLNGDGSLYVPADPRAVSWASQDVGPGSAYGTTILVSHVNFAGVNGVFTDLADYEVGQIITLTLADGRTMRYAVAAPPIEVNKDQLAPRRQELFDQSHSYGLGSEPKSGRLLLLSCGGVFDNRTGHYESNIFVYALPV